MNKLILLLTLFANTCFSQTESLGTIRGVIHDSTTGEPVLYAKVIVSNADSVPVGGAYSDFDGIFIISQMASGIYYVTIEEIEHKMKIVSDVELKPGGIVTLKVVLPKKEQMLEPVIIDRINCGGPRPIDSIPKLKR